LIKINGRSPTVGYRRSRDAVVERAGENVMKKTLAIVMAVWGLTVGLRAQIADFTPQTPLIGALLHNDMAEAKRLLEHGADPNEGRFFGFPPVFLAIQRQNLDVFQMMVAKGADLSVRDRSGSTALMWAAFNEDGDADLVEELLKLGADPLAKNSVGETALDWGRRRGDTPAVAVLFRSGVSDEMKLKVSIEKSLSLLQQSGSQFARVSACYSCHHQSLPQMALGIARTRGLQLDEPAARQQVDTMIGVLKSVYEQAVNNRDRIPDPPIALSYTLLGLAAENYPADEITEALAHVIAAWQSDDGAFYPLPAVRPPLESNEVTATALSLRALQLYGTHQEPRVARAREWLHTAQPRSTEARAMQLLGLAWAKAAADDISKSAAALLALQREDGGWAQLQTLETDAYATGQALVALATAGHATSSPEYRRGIAFLRRTQFADGSWLVRTRSFPVQPPKDSGFPHGRHQWISAAGTSWAAMALSLALPPQSALEATH
jgi:Ankyrin repeats (3 copies)